MTLFHALQIGEYHTNHCEDFLQVAPIGKNRILCAVMDGCTMATDSYLAATLTGKVLRKIAKEFDYREFITGAAYDLPLLLEKVTCQLFSEWRQLKNFLQLEREEVLNTLLLAVVDADARAGEFFCVGDGLICINNDLFEFEQDNKPDYLGYHLEEDFDSWYLHQKQRLSAVNIHDFSIASDGIFTFKPFDDKSYSSPGHVINHLLLDATGAHDGQMLDRKLNEIRFDWGLKPTDDLAIIRGIL